MFQDASVIILSNFSTSAVMGAVKFLVKYCISIVPDSCASATPEYVFCCPESPNKAMAVTLRRQQNMYTTYQYNKSKIPQKKNQHLTSVSCYLSELTLSVITGCVSLFSRSHMWRLEAASSTQKTVGLVWDHCSETTASPDVPFFHSATGCSWLTACSLMLPSPHPTWNIWKKVSKYKI